MEFEKWHALGNDYVIVEQERLRFELTPARIRAICAPHTGVGADGILLLAPSTQPGSAAQLRIFNPDGSEAELSGNGAREAVLYLHRRDPDSSAGVVSLHTPAGEVRGTITSSTSCTLDMGRASLQSPDYPAGGRDGTGELTAAGHTWHFRHVHIGNPQCAIALGDEAALDALTLAEVGPPIEHNELFPNRTNVSWYVPLASGRIRARIFERGVGETRASGTGASGAAVAYVLSGGDSPVTVQLDGGELEIDVDEGLHVSLTGWAVPVFGGALAADFVEELREAE